MPEATLELTVPDDIWMGELSRTYSGTTFEILSALPGNGTGVALVELTGGDLSSVVEMMHSCDMFSEFAVLTESDERALVQFETTEPLLLTLARESGVPLELPLTLENGTVVWKLTASAEGISELGSLLDSLGIAYRIRSLNQDTMAESLLTEAQQEVVMAAIEMGYYNTPRECSLTDIAEEGDRAKSTVSELLHRAEGAIITEFVRKNS